MTINIYCIKQTISHCTYFSHCAYLLNLIKKMNSDEKRVVIKILVNVIESRKVNKTRLTVKLKDIVDKVVDILHGHHTTSLKNRDKTLYNFIRRTHQWKTFKENQIGEKATIITKAKDTKVPIRTSGMRRKIYDISEELSSRDKHFERPDQHALNLAAGPKNERDIKRYYALCDNDLRTSYTRSTLVKRLNNQNICAIGARNMKSFNVLSGQRKLKELMDLLVGTKVIAINLGENQFINYCEPLEALKNHILSGGNIRRYFIESCLISKQSRRESGLFQVMKAALKRDSIYYNVMNIYPIAPWLQLDSAGWKAIGESKCEMGMGCSEVKAKLIYNKWQQSL